MKEPKRRGTDNFGVLCWRDDSITTLGEGISRTNAKDARLWKVQVTVPGEGNLLTIVRARNKREALLFSKNRHQRATSITFIGQA